MNGVCPWCGPVSRGRVVEVHGHVQCAACGTNIEPCCSGEVADAGGRFDGDE